MFTNKDDYLKYIPKYIQDNSTLITPESINQNYLIHLSNIKHKDDILIPNVSRRAALVEDNTLARVHTSTDILGCLYGIAITHLNVINNHINKNTNKLVFNNGYYVYKIPFEYALRPNTKLVFDVEQSNEMWLTRYENVDNYKAQLVGHLIIDHVSVIPTDSSPLFTTSFLLNTNDTIKLDSIKEIDKGNIEFDFTIGVTKQLDPVKIRQYDYEGKKQLHASMLSINDNINIPFFKGL
jgi:hypothetical protein